MQHPAIHDDSEVILELFLFLDPDHEVNTGGEVNTDDVDVNDAGDFNFPEAEELVDSDGEAGSVARSDDDEPRYPIPMRISKGK